jgi:hypothetical protein
MVAVSTHIERDQCDLRPLIMLLKITTLLRDPLFKTNGAARPRVVIWNIYCRREILTSNAKTLISDTHRGPR